MMPESWLRTVKVSGTYGVPAQKLLHALGREEEAGRSSYVAMRDAASGSPNRRKGGV